MYRIKCPKLTHCTDWQCNVTNSTNFSMAAAILKSNLIFAAFWHSVFISLQLQEV